MLPFSPKLADNTDAMRRISSLPSQCP